MKLNKLVKISLLSAISIVLAYFALPLPFFPPWLKIDLGDLPAIIAAFAFGPLSGIIVEVIKNALVLVIRNSGTFGIGEAANFIIGAMMVLPAGLIYKKSKNKRSALIGLIVGVISMTIGGVIINYLVIFPVYEILMHFTLPKSTLITAILPFNILKGTILGILTLLLYKRISPILHKKLN